ncbi:EpsG family protein [Spirochaetia bacterium 38H-sp]|uniref:EpsG family protein n=1 Tax=Rarispira pelagica TaxID=3141764 RepID=A0ABU9U9Y5_9SPIR
MALLIRILWVLQHFFSVVTLSKKYWRHFIIFSILIFVFIYIIKPDTADIPVYVQVVNNPHAFLEPAYNLLASIAFFLTQNNRFAVFIIQVVLSLLFVSVLRYYKLSSIEYIVGLIFIISGLAFSLGVNNGLRQAFSSVFILFSLLALICKKRFSMLLYAILSIFFHKSGFLFLFLTFSVALLIKRMYFGDIYRQKMTLSSSLLYSVMVLSGIIGVILMMLIIPKIPFLGGYFQKSYIGLGSRVAGYIKIIPIFFIFIVSEIFWGKYCKIITNFSFLRMIRGFYIVFLLALSAFSYISGFFDEAIARILYFYYVIEMGLVLAAIEEKKLLGSVSISIGYAFAINAMNILGGPL